MVKTKYNLLFLKGLINDKTEGREKRQGKAAKVFRCEGRHTKDRQGAESKQKPGTKARL